MDSQLKVIFVCFIVNSIIVCNVSTVDANVLDNSVYYHENDVSKMSSKDIYNLHHGFVEEVFKWKDGQINFKIDKNFNDYEIDKILAAMYEIERSSCIRFTAHDSSDGPDYVMIKKDYTNRFTSSAELGCVHKGEQALSLSIDMINDHQTILHELFHTIGFGHHHQRSDRDNYIEIHYENTDLSELDILMNFAPKVSFDSRMTYLTPFDFNSVMLYNEDGFSANNKSVITSKIEGSRIPSSDRDRGLSPYDVILLNRFYDCNTVDKRKSKIFYETALGILYPKIVNFHEIQRAKDYIELNVPQDVELTQIVEKSDDANNLVTNVTDEADKDENEDEDEFRDNEEDYIDEESQTDGRLQDGQNINLTSSVVDRLHVDRRIEENLVDENDTILAKNKEEQPIKYQHANPGTSRLSEYRPYIPPLYGKLWRHK
ncbi:zinc metalloproteinase nas-6-like isoform X3 [Bradysia coprophila]|uniref:zinc metalloproteinase nas-6-like isoform X3 n=1 Tax=Bradysia coprophila TaxID=38358 RepID=UPI00187D77EC|nr:zinc metalloproteinase nas-6-like isoform X3 [Bradysia coprophila]